MPPGVTVEPNGLTQTLFRERYDENGKILNVAFAGTIPDGSLFTLRGANASSAKVTGRVNGVTVEIRKVEIATSVESNVSPPMNFALDQNYPNPFNPTTTIVYNLPVVASVKLEVFDLTGRSVKTLVDKTESAGSHTVAFDASGLGSGMYFYRIQAGTFSAMRKMVFLK